MAPYLTLYFITVLTFVLTMMYACWCFLVLTTLLFFTEMQWPIRKSNRSCHISFRKHSPGNKLMLYDALLTYDWSSLCSRPLLTFQSLPVTWCTFNNCTFCPNCIYVFCIYLRTNSDLCHLQHKLIGFITEMKSVYCAVRTGSSNKAVCASCLKG